MSKKIEWLDINGEVCFLNHLGEVWKFDDFSVSTEVGYYTCSLTRDEILQIAEKIKEIRNGE